MDGGRGFDKIETIKAPEPRWKKHLDRNAKQAVLHQRNNTRPRPPCQQQSSWNLTRAPTVFIVGHSMGSNRVDLLEHSMATCLDLKSKRHTKAVTRVSCADSCTPWISERFKNYIKKRISLACLQKKHRV